MATAHVNDIDIHYQWDGDINAGHTIALSNSLASNLSMWNAQVEALGDAGFRILRYDSRGHGKTSAPDVAYTFDMLTADLVGLLDHLELSAVHFCGLSMGGMVGQNLGANYPQRVRSLTLCATAAYLSAPGVWDERRQIVLEQGMSVIVEPTLERWFTQDGLRAGALGLDEVREGILTTPTVGYANSCLAIRDMDQRESIRNIKAPTMIIAGRDDPSTPVAAAEEIHRAIPGSELTVIDNAQHFLNVEQASAFNDCLSGFLARHK